MADKIIYIVTSGEYSDYGIRGVFDDKELAEIFVKMLDRSYYAHPNVEEWPINPGAKQIRAGLKYFRITISKDGNILNCDDRVTPPDDGKPYRRIFMNYDKILVAEIGCWARDEEHAKKIAIEKRQELNATNGWK